MLKLFCCLDKVGVVDTVVNVESYFNVRMAEPSRNNLDRTRAQSSVSESVAQNVKAERFINSDRGTKPVPIIKQSAVDNRSA